MIKNNTDKIFIISQHFYGNRTGTEVRRDWIDHFLRGHISRDLFGADDIKDVKRKVIHVSGSDNIVIVYDQTREDAYVKEEFPET
jgi:hypothetical protein